MPHLMILINVLFYYRKIILSTLFAFPLYIANVKPIRGKCTQRILYHSTLHVHPCLRSGKHTDSRCTSWKSTLLARARCAVSSMRIHPSVVGCLSTILYDYARSCQVLLTGQWAVSLSTLASVSRSHKIMPSQYDTTAK